MASPVREEREVLRMGVVLLVQMAQVAEDDSWSGLPEWLIGVLALAAVGLAVLSVILMFARTRPSPDDTESSRYPTLTREPVLIISALVIIALAVLVMRAEG